MDCIKIIKMGFIAIVFLLSSCVRNEKQVYLKGEETLTIFNDSDKIVLHFDSKTNKINHINLFESDEIYNLYFDSLPKIGIYGSVKNRSDSKEYSDFKSYFINPFDFYINDSIKVSKRESVNSIFEYRVNGSLIYSSVYENGVKTYNALNLKLIDSQFLNENEVDLLLRVNFDFSGELRFKYYNKNQDIPSEKISKNLYLLRFKNLDEDFSKILFDVEIVPDPKDTILNSTFVQQIDIK